MNSPSLVSVVIVTYNRKNAVVSAVESALAQTYAPLEIIVVDDASVDGTNALMEALVLKHPNVIFVKNARNMGFVKNLNKGAGLARGKYIARLDDDDTWIDANKIKKQVDFLEQHPEYVLVGGGVVKVSTNGKEIVRYLLLENDEEIRKALLVDNVFAHSTTLFSREAFVKAGGYQERFGFFADWGLWLEMGRWGKMHNFQEFFIHYTDQEENKTNSMRDRLIRRKLFAKINLHRTYGRYYSGSKKALLLSLASWCYSFIPFRKKLWPLIFRIRKVLFGSPPYKYF